MDTRQEERQFELAQESFGITLLRRARQRASELPPAAHGQPPDTPLAEAASEAFGSLLGHVFALLEDKRIRDALRVVVHLGRKVRAPCFIKTGPCGHRISHVVLVRTAEDLRTVVPFLREAFELAVNEKS